MEERIILTETERLILRRFQKNDLEDLFLVKGKIKKVFYHVVLVGKK